MEGKLYISGQERAFKGEDVVRFPKHLMPEIGGKPLVIREAPRSIAAKQSKASSQAGRLLGCEWGNRPGLGAPGQNPD